MAYCKITLATKQLIADSTEAITVLAERYNVSVSTVKRVRKSLQNGEPLAKMKTHPTVLAFSTIAPGSFRDVFQYAEKINQLGA